MRLYLDWVRWSSHLHQLFVWLLSSLVWLKSPRTWFVLKQRSQDCIWPLQHEMFETKKVVFQIEVLGKLFLSPLSRYLKIMWYFDHYSWTHVRWLDPNSTYMRMVAICIMVIVWQVSYSSLCLANASWVLLKSKRSIDQTFPMYNWYSQFIMRRGRNAEQFAERDKVVWPYDFWNPHCWFHC